jgi:hypothetical protein
MTAARLSSGENLRAFEKAEPLVALSRGTSSSSRRRRKMDSNFKVAFLTGGAAILAAAVTAAGILMNTYITASFDRQKAELQLLTFAADGTSQVAYCNVLLWKKAGLLDTNIADQVAAALKAQRSHVADNCDI